MPLITRKKASEMLAKEAEKVDADLLVEIYNYINRMERITIAQAERDLPAVRTKVLEYIKQVEAEQIVDFWFMLFPDHRRRWFDEEKNRFHYDETPELYPAD